MILDRTTLKVACEKHGIPDYMHGAIERYVFDGIHPGDFLTALFSNDFMEAAIRADSTNIECFRAYAMLFYNDLPRGCWGSPELMREWMGLRRAVSHEDSSQ